MTDQIGAFCLEIERGRGLAGELGVALAVGDPAPAALSSVFDDLGMFGADTGVEQHAGGAACSSSDSRHTPMRYSPITDRPTLRLPGGARVAVYVGLNVETYAPGGPGPGADPLAGQPAGGPDQHRLARLRPPYRDRTRALRGVRRSSLTPSLQTSGRTPARPSDQSRIGRPCGSRRWERPHSWYGTKRREL